MKFSSISPSTINYNLRNLPQLAFEVTDKCNLNCKYCAYSDLYQNYDKRQGKYISFTIAKQMIDYLRNLWCENFFEQAKTKASIGFYGGEPLMNMKFIKQVVDYVESLEKIGIVYSYSMTTNAVLLDKYMDFLVEKNIGLLVSLDGAEFAHSYRVDHSGKNSFSRVFHNLQLLQAKYPDYLKNRVNFNSILHNRNDIETIYSFINSHFDKTPIFSTLTDTGIYENKKDEFKEMYRNMSESFNSAKNKDDLECQLTNRTPRIAALANYIQYQSGNVFNTYNDLYIDQDALDYVSTGTCTPFSKRIFITVNGKILPCEKVGHQFSMGQVYDDRVELNAEYIADIHNYYTSKNAQQCINCAVSSICLQCVYRIDNIDSLYNENIQCPSFCSAKKFEKNNETSFEFLKNYPHYYRRILDEDIFK